MKTVAFVEMGEELGGSVFSSFDIMNHLSTADANLRLLYLVGDASEAHLAAKELGLKAAILPWTPKSLKIRNFQKLFLHMVKAYRFLKANQVDTVHSTNHTILWWIVPCWLARVELIWNVRAMVGADARSKFREFLYWLFRARPVCVSVGVKETLSLFKNEEVQVIPNFVPKYLCEPLPEKKDAVGVTLRVGFVGRMKDPVKDVGKAFRISRRTLEVVESQKLNVRLEFLFFGDIDQSVKEEFLLSLPHGIRNRINFQDGLSPLEIFPQIDLLLLTSRMEGFPRVILEAAIFGIPSLASKVGGVSELIKDDVTGWFISSEEAASTLLASLVLDPSRVRSAGSAARDHFLEKYHWERISKMYLNLYGLR